MLTTIVPDLRRAPPPPAVTAGGGGRARRQGQCWTWEFPCRLVMFEVRRVRGRDGVLCEGSMP